MITASSACPAAEMITATILSLVPRSAV